MNNVVALPTRALQIALTVSDPDVVHELETRTEGAARDAYAGHALRLGVLALRHASGSLDADVIRREGEQLVKGMADVLQQRTTEVSQLVTQSMVKYLEPSSGVLPLRIEQLTKPNGDLDSLLAKHLCGDQSLIAQTLARHLGEQSPIFKLLSPKQSDGLLAALSDTIKRALEMQRDEVLKQFSLDHKDSALSRLVAEVTSSNGKFRDDLSEDVGKMVQEFSLDNEEGALSRLVSRVERAQKTITSEFSLDHEGSALQRLSSMLERTHEAVEGSLTLDDEAAPLARIRREILDVLAQQQKANGDFQSEVRTTLESFKARREEAARSTTHGHLFEDQLAELLSREAERIGDLYERVGEVSGRSQRKVGDYCVELGPESACPGARIVFEAKANKQYTLKTALAELENARKNREAQVGVMVFHRDSAPKGLESLRRVGSDILVVWDAEDVSSDLFVKTAYDVARALAHRAAVADAETAADLSAIDALVESIAKHLSTLESIEKSARAIKKNGESLLSGVQEMRDKLCQEIEQLRERVAELRTQSDV